MENTFELVDIFNTLHLKMPNKEISTRSSIAGLSFRQTLRSLPSLNHYNLDKIG